MSHAWTSTKVCDAEADTFRWHAAFIGLYRQYIKRADQPHGMITVPLQMLIGPKAYNIVDLEDTSSFEGVASQDDYRHAPSRHKAARGALQY